MTDELEPTTDVQRLWRLAPVLPTNRVNLAFFAGREPRQDGSGFVSQMVALEQYLAEHPTGNLRPPGCG
jgi:hypothetical protein